MADPLRRLHGRHALQTAVGVRSFSTGARVGEGMLVDIGLGGALLRIGAVLERRVTYVFAFSLDGPILELPGRVVRDGPRDPAKPGVRRYGIQFNLTTAQERALQTQLKAALRPPPPARRDIMRDYWDR